MLSEGHGDVEGTVLHRGCSDQWCVLHLLFVTTQPASLSAGNMGSGGGGGGPTSPRESLGDFPFLIARLFVVPVHTSSLVWVFHGH